MREANRPSRPSEERGSGPAAPLAAGFLTFTILVIVQLAVSRPVLIAERLLPGAGWLEIALLSCYAVFLVRKMANPRLSAKWRSRIWLWFSAVFFIQLALGIAGFERFLMTGELHLPVPAVIIAGPLYRGEGLFMPILLGATLLLVGPAWCSYLCYLGAWDDRAARALRKPRSLPRWRRTLQVTIGLGTVATALGLRLAGAQPTAAILLGGVFGLVGVAIMLWWSRRTGQMTHCIAWCPIGALATWFGRLSPFRLRIGAACNDCGACTTFCRYDALTEHDIAQRRPGATCTLCGDCIRSCKDRVIEYRLPGLSADPSRLTFLVLVVSLHAVFMGLART